MTFKDLGLSEELLKAVTAMGFEKPSEIQEKSIPELLNTERDYVGLAQTGTGKTAAFGLPMIQQIDTEYRAIQGLILRSVFLLNYLPHISKAAASGENKYPGTKISKTKHVDRATQAHQNTRCNGLASAIIEGFRH